MLCHNLVENSAKGADFFPPLHQRTENTNTMSSPRQRAFTMLETYARKKKKTPNPQTFESSTKINLCHRLIYKSVVNEKSVEHLKFC